MDQVFYIPFQAEEKIRVGFAQEARQKNSKRGEVDSPELLNAISSGSEDKVILKSGIPSQARQKHSTVKVFPRSSG
ncbi:hypothetical protein CHS0354_032009 [Potamilus streckersoni]|uniref:Uncharacterized protein n=1 Tax=Potamilus streckersoni TaxID=2493646 RepID=A0AAE0TL42_9BIVA|nr:hypothetical protein CHS0354_032009 [Potamilus streckersoni]